MAKNCSGCNSCGNSNRCSRVTTRNSGALRAVRGTNNCNCGNSCACNNNCGSHNCSCCNHNNCNNCSSCNVPSSCPCATTCAGSRLFYTGPCGRTNNGCCGGVCHNHCGCQHHNCNNCHICGCNGCENNCDCCHECHCGCECHDCDGCEDDCDCDTYASAAEFVAAAPQTCAAGEGFSFRAENCPGDGFSVCDGGVRIKRCGRYIAMYSFSAPAGANAAADICLELNGRSLASSRCHVEPAVFARTRSAAGQALFTAEKGDVIALTTSTALSVPDTCGAPAATLIIHSVD